MFGRVSTFSSPAASRTVADANLQIHQFTAQYHTGRVINHEALQAVTSNQSQTMAMRIACGPMRFAHHPAGDQAASPADAGLFKATLKAVSHLL